MNELTIPKGFEREAAYLASPVHPDTPDYQSMKSIPDTPDGYAHALGVFTFHGMELSDEAWKAIKDDYETTCAFLHDYSDMHPSFEGSCAKMSDYVEAYKRSVVRMINRFKTQGNYDDPINKVMEAFLDAMWEDPVAKKAFDDMFTKKEQLEYQCDCGENCGGRCEK